jgi:hypothetical protein
MSLLLGIVLIGGQHLEIPVIVTYQSQGIDGHDGVYIEDAARNLTISLRYHPCIISLADVYRRTLKYSQWNASITFAAYRHMTLLHDAVTGMRCSLSVR